jgi:hypothetical protein
VWVHACTRARAHTHTQTLRLLITVNMSFIFFNWLLQSLFADLGLP